MTTIKIKDYNVEFPYEKPYDIQNSYMEKVMECLHNKVHGVLESPTGTGKTLCLLAPVSSWLRRQKELSNYEDALNIAATTKPRGEEKEVQWGARKKTVVWYTARTHSQIAQTMAEVRKCNITGLKIRVLGARDQLCINPDVMNETESYIKQIKCKELTKAKSCRYHKKLQQERDGEKYYRTGEVLDIEDLVSIGKSCSVCPYYLSKEGLETADIVFLPYNYIIDKESRVANQLNLKGDVVIFDEGHNVPTSCEESFEFTFTSTDLSLGVKSVQEVMHTIASLQEEAVDDEEDELARHAENALFMVEILEKMESGLMRLKLRDELMDVSELYKFFEDAGLTHSTASQLARGVDDFIAASSRLSLSGSMITTLQILEKVTGTIFGPTVRIFDKETIDRSFKWGLTPGKVNGKRLSLYCFNPSFGIREILNLGVKPIIITSGTLSPLRTFIHELRLPSPITLQNGHIAQKCQVPFLILGTGVNKVRMDATFANRSSNLYIESLGLSLTNLVASVPDGILILFSSYSMMAESRRVWENKTLDIWKRLNSLKRVFIEQRGKTEFIECMENYKRAIDAGNGAILMGVLRGKISEGMDFKDQYCRAVFIIGVPFPPVKEPRVVGKEKYSESLKFVDPKTKREQKLYTCSFKSVEAMKATNQAIGRVIRHGKDYGAIILVDHRFSSSWLFNNISPWIRGTTPVELNFGQAKKLLGDFFRNVHQEKLGVPEVRCQRVDNNGCPIAGYVSYEEYEHKRLARMPAPWIAVNSSDSIAEERRPKRDIDTCFMEHKEDLESLKARYSSSQLSKRPVISKTGSVFDALDIVGIVNSDDETVTADRTNSGLENAKRKFEDDKDIASLIRMNCVDGPSTMKKSRKITKVKIRPFENSAENGETVLCDEDFLSQYKDGLDIFTKKDRIENKTELKNKLIHYFNSNKNILTKDEADEHKAVSVSYLKGERTLTEVINLMDKICITQEKLRVFIGFEVCVKSKDRVEWKNACQMRGMN